MMMDVGVGGGQPSCRLKGLFVLVSESVMGEMKCRKETEIMETCRLVLGNAFGMLL